MANAKDTSFCDDQEVTYMATICIYRCRGTRGGTQTPRRAEHYGYLSLYRTVERQKRFRYELAAI